MTAIRRHQQLVEGGIRDEVREGMTDWKNIGGGGERRKRDGCREKLSTVWHEKVKGSKSNTK